jgi:hypothetical protein
MFFRNVGRFSADYTHQVQRNSHRAFYVIVDVKNASSASMHSLQGKAKVRFQSLLKSALGYNKET